MNKNILHIPSLAYFGNDWDTLQNFLKHRGNPTFHIDGNLDLTNTPIKSLGNLTSVGGYLDLENTIIESLGNLTSVKGFLDVFNTPIKSLGNLTSVDGDLNISNTSIKDLGNLTLVGWDFYMGGTPLSEKMKESDIRSQVKIGGDIYFK